MFRSEMYIHVYLTCQVLKIMGRLILFTMYSIQATPSRRNPLPPLISTLSLMPHSHWHRYLLNPCVDAEYVAILTFSQLNNFDTGEPSASRLWLSQPSMLASCPASRNAFPSCSAMSCRGHSRHLCPLRQLIPLMDVLESTVPQA